MIAGLGNPGEEYEHTRHNAGFDTVDALADELGVRYWKNEGGALVGKASYRGHELLLVKPQSFMNTSGGPVSKLMRAYGVAPDHLIVVHDELDIEPGTIRVKFGGGHAGHNGLRSICDKLGTRDWFRVRIGIGLAAGTQARGRLGALAPAQQGRHRGFRSRGVRGCGRGAVPHRQRAGEDPAEIQLARIPRSSVIMAEGRGASLRSFCSHVPDFGCPSEISNALSC